MSVRFALVVLCSLVPSGKHGDAYKMDQVASRGARVRDDEGRHGEVLGKKGEELLAPTV